MTEREWLDSSDPRRMLRIARVSRRQRKLRLFAAACCRMAWPRLPDLRSRCAVEAAERFADDLVGAAEVTAIREAAFRVADESWAGTGNPQEMNMPAFAAASSLIEELSYRSARDIAAMTVQECPDVEEEHSQAGLIRELFGNPFHPIAADPAWLTPAVVQLAEATYAERELPSGRLDAARLAVLADALEEAGCDSADLLAHLRSPGPHVRGCWALDLVLGKV